MKETNLGCSKKRQRVHHNPSTSRRSSCAAVFDSPAPSLSDKTATKQRSASFNDSSTADVILRLFIAHSPFNPSDSDTVSTTDCQSSDLQIYLHSQVLRRSMYFTALLSDRWKQPQNDDLKPLRLHFGVSVEAGSMDIHLRVLQLLYAEDLSDSIDNVSTALEILPVALEFLFEDCVEFCVKYLEAVPWSEEEEKRVISVIPLLQEKESKELLARVCSCKNDSNEEMLRELISATIHNHPNMAFVKAFLAKLLRDFSSRELSKTVLEKAFESSLKVVKDSLEEFSSPDFRGDHNETEAIQRLNLHTAVTNGRHMLWLVERMIELKVADDAMKQWTEQIALPANLEKVLVDGAWKNIVPGLPTLLLRCTCKLANAVAGGKILAPKEVRKKIVKDWLPVLAFCKEHVSPIASNYKSLYLEMEETFLKIISTLPMSDAQELLQQCVSFATRNVEDCPHLITAFRTWFRRASFPPQTDNT